MAKWLYPERAAALDPQGTLDALYGQFLDLDNTGAFWTSPAAPAK